MHRSRLLLSLAAAAGLLVACGSYTKQDFIARADAICVNSVRATRLIAPPAFTTAKAQQLRALAAYTAAVLPIVQTEAKQLRGLPRPKASAREASQLTGFLAAFTNVAADYGALETAAGGADSPGVARAEASLTASPVRSLAAAYGLRSCGTAGATYNS